MEHNEAGSGLQDLTSRDADYQSNPLRLHAQHINDISFCASPADTAVSRRKNLSADSKSSLGGMLRHGIVQHQLGISLNLLFLLGMTYAFFPSLRERLTPFFTLQYALRSGLHYQGPQDTWIVLGYIVLFTGMRAACMDYMLIPFARVCGIRKKKAQIRFAEQAYLLLYYTVIWTWGMREFIADTPASSATTLSGWTHDLLMSLWKGFPVLTLSASMKAYYLVQTAFWLQQIIVIHLEERRKDHWQMLAHHFITCGLLISSYSCRMTRVGNAILNLMDVVDLVFPLAKCLRYLGLQTACDIAFGVFVVTWCLARHVSYLTILYSLCVHNSHTIMLYGTYSTIDSHMISTDVNNDILGNMLQTMINPGATTVQWNPVVRWTFIIMLGGLQVITCVWFVMICRVVARVLRGEGADDSRSDGEDEEQEVQTRPVTGKRPSEQKFIEITAEADDLYYSSQRVSSSSNRPSGIRKKSKGISSGLNLGEHKDILNRIGCLSEEQLAREAERRQDSNSPQPGAPRRF
ncbi:hypothetical protein AMS68_005421 [Peltaster fructicola]|uniref:TLC domain-containing protein n=1 Tax=Peltaster fructicola TaxID=286661 RepID=A0A6H0XYT0_9PEZI|nr:hypothetical protein AMS68_005421 [Peltaster fructicola]